MQLLSFPARPSAFSTVTYLFPLVCIKNRKGKKRKWKKNVFWFKGGRISVATPGIKLKVCGICSIRRFLGLVPCISSTKASPAVRRFWLASWCVYGWNWKTTIASVHLSMIENYSAVLCSDPVFICFFSSALVFQPWQTWQQYNRWAFFFFIYLKF